MNWGDQLTRIRRFLRDPDGDIWSDALLLRLYNDEQDDLQNTTGHLEDVQVVRVPSEFQTSYTQDFEWAFSDHSDGDVLLVGYYDDHEDINCCNMWEIQHNRAFVAASDAVYWDGDLQNIEWDSGGVEVLWSGRHE